ncbi:MULTISPECIES: DUF805 domain-containing protein [unclassified Brevibacterium]|uniref:DUF805 domain-containing protein n=1 Tax=unclassified Brevibacterium TaxID=2614124 RepID=UPI001E42EEDD|nr:MULTISPECIES: DUF805 domain-containing protein [unclassified Brevibacterium]MCD1286592.1 DUF805 domain-containing protein [Brevibacterium sp. CCUG 69071]MDK8434177.1 DUF805 domain-containing protein [Brevibacterium sp. H-BE7]
MSYDANSAYPTGPGAAGPGGQGFGAAPRGASSPEDLSLPLYGASFGQAVKRFFKNYTKFTGRASRSEYWFAYLFLLLLTIIPGILYSIGLGMIAATTSMASADPYGMQTAAPSGGAIALTAVGGILMLIIGLATIIPHLAIIWRRLHDGNFAGPFFFLSFIPGVGSIILLVLMILPSKPEGQRFDV